MGVTVVVGAQWGDEGKGKIVDYLAERAEMVVRFQGGANAGHTVYRGETAYKFHLLPCGVLHKGVRSVIARGVALDLELLAEEMGQLEQENGPLDLLVSPQAFLVLPHHRWFDKLEELRRGEGKIGTTYRGIGPASTDRTARRGLRVGHLFADDLPGRVQGFVDRANGVLDGVYSKVASRRLDADRLLEDLAKAREMIRPYVGDTMEAIHSLLDKGKNVLLEGAQGCLLDVGFGTYPFVTSSHTISGSACVNTGIAPSAIDKTYGIAKAYITRVGAGPFPTKMDSDWDERVRKAGGEFGATTGRPRDCGWLDLVLLRYAHRLCGFTGIVLTKADVLGGMGPLKVATSWLWRGREYRQLPEDPRVWDEAEPQYVEVPGWEAFSGGSDYETLPQGLKDYCSFIEEEVGAPIVAVSTGPGMDELAWRT